jgi:transformation/transcription domain-associated protein
LIESPAQKKAREDSEAMGEYWTGMAPTITNPQLYADFINAQIKVSVTHTNNGFLD